MADSIRVLHYFAFPGGGIGRYCHELLSHMVSLPGLEIELACIPSYHYRDQAQYPIWPGLRDITHPWPLRRRLRFAINLFVNPLRAIQRAKQTWAQIIHLSTIPHVTFALWSRALKKNNLRLVATAHDVRRSQGLIWYRYEIEQLKRLYRTCDALFVHSNYQKNDLIDFAGVSADKVHIVPHGPYYHGPPQADKETLRRRYGIPLDKQVALFFGDIRPDKNLDLFLRAMVPFKDRLFLVVAGQAKGRGENGRRDYQKLVEQLGLCGCVSLRLEYIPNEEVPNYFEMCDWVAMPYSSRFTSQSGVLNVAMAYRRPVLITATPTIAESLEQFMVGIMVSPDSQDAVRQGIQEFLSSPQLAWHATIESYLRVCSWTTNAQSTFHVYCECVRRLG